MMLRSIFIFAFVALSWLQAHAEKTYILIDHSASMANEGAQEEARIDLQHFVSNLNDSDEISVAYFGGSNGGDCRSDVTVPSPVLKSQIQLSNPQFLADGDNPLLAALDEISSRHSSDAARVIVVSDFDAVCGATQSACMAVYGYRELFPNINFEFEPVGDVAAQTELFQCLLSSLEPAESNETKRFAFDVDISTSGSGVENDYSVTLVALNYLAALIVMMFLGWLVSIGSRHNAKVRGHSGELVPRKYLFQRGKLSVTSIDFSVLVLTLIFVIGFSITYYCLYSSAASSWQQTFELLNDRFGAGVASTLLVGFLGWCAYTTYNDRLIRLESGFSDKLKELQTETQRNKYQQILSAIESTFEQNLELIEKQKSAVKQLPAYDQSDELENLHTELVTSARDLWAAIKTSVTPEKPDAWRKSSFLRPLALFKDVNRNAPKAESAASDYARRLERWTSKCEEINSRKLQTSTTGSADRP
ncbi:MAG: hypothetical protein ACE37M_02405 [Henriciella sp.]